MQRRKIPAGSGGFTLVELLVVMGIISVLTGIIVSVITNIDKHRVPCTFNLREIGIAALQYSNDHGFYPWTQDGEPACVFQLLVDEGLIDEPKLFICPACMHQEADYNDGDFVLAPENVSYAYAARPVSYSAPSRTPIVADGYLQGEHGQGHRDYILVYRKSGAVQELNIQPGQTWDEVTAGKLRR